MALAPRGRDPNPAHRPRSYRSPAALPRHNQLSGIGSRALDAAKWQVTGYSRGPNSVTLNGKLMLADTTITSDGPSYATNVAYRTDSARNFIKQLVTLP